MSVLPATWFVVQLVAAVLAVAGGRRLARLPSRAWKVAATCAAACMLFWPLMRLCPAQVLDLLGPQVVIFIEVTGICVPAALLFSIAAVHVPKATERRALYVMLGVCGLYFARFGAWMVRPAVPDLGTCLFRDDVCLQSTDYTCVAASMVTMLRAYGIDASETEMARLSFTEVGFGTTDSRAVYALEEKLADPSMDICYESMDYDQLCRVPQPCLVSIRWGYFVSHMVPVLAADANGVTVGDPLTGGRQVPKEEFLGIWKGSGIYLRGCRLAGTDSQTSVTSATRNE